MNIPYRLFSLLSSVRLFLAVQMLKADLKGLEKRE
jgi:hypothetical protein